MLYMIFLINTVFSVRIISNRCWFNNNQSVYFCCKTDKQVKINGLGTFKVQAVAPRKSVDVNTGEEIIIEGYNKLVFAPEAGVKELVEKQPKEIDPLKKLGAQAEEIVEVVLLRPIKFALTEMMGVFQTFFE